jgi:hypothetical protein
MVKILITANRHPGEPFSISVASKTAEKLRELGYEVVFRKFTLAESLWGHNYFPAGTYPPELHPEEKTCAKLEEIREKINPDYTFDFHCTPHKSGFWKFIASDKQNFIFVTNENSPVLSVEVKAVEKEIPLRARETIEKIMGTLPRGSHYARTTSHQLSRAAGLHPETIASNVAQAIHARIERINHEPTWEQAFVKRRVYDRAAVMQRLQRMQARKKLLPHK